MLHGSATNVVSNSLGFTLLINKLKEASVTVLFSKQKITIRIIEH